MNIDLLTFLFHAVHEFGDRVIVIIDVWSTHCPVDTADYKFDSRTCFTGRKINVLEHDGKYEFPVRVRCVKLRVRERKSNACKPTSVSMTDSYGGREAGESEG